MEEQNKRRVLKKIIGVPVIPGLPNLPLTIEVATDDTDTHNDGEISPRTRSRTPSTGSGSTVAVHSRLPWKLGHIDFLPKQIKEKNDDGFENFKSLVSSANDWLKKNTYARLFTCESIFWMTIDKPVYTDNGILSKSMNADKKTRCFRGLRIWYYTTDDTFYDNKTPSTTGTPAYVSVVDYTADGKSDNIKTILSRINSDLAKKPLTGRLMRLETLHIPSEIDSQESFWKEEPNQNKSFSFFLRLFIVNRPDLQPERAPELGIQDFSPDYTQRTPHNQGYETYTDTWKKVARWIYQNVGLKMINIQSVFIKNKKDAASGNEDLAHRCIYTEHGSAYSSLHQAKTEYIQITRVIYVKHASAAASAEKKPDSDRVKLAYRTFAPGRLPRESSVAGEEELSEGAYEDVGQMEERMNTWIQKLGAHQLVGMETVPVRLLTGGQEALGSDATFVYNCRERNLGREPWRVNIRLYLTGRVQDLPPSSSRTQSRSSVNM